jgi:hypothetical protein
MRKRFRGPFAASAMMASDMVKHFEEAVITNHSHFD